ncbi:hypothetical protein [Burkholderia ubonensis]|uniref:hypothetical protein n=1 Tax=Burkholderia ubonensis TaxID=101571 RepID=UPI0012FB35CD|nr:hypothetical protein [Burkholderia ubonensis]
MDVVAMKAIKKISALLLFAGMVRGGWATENPKFEVEQGKEWSRFVYLNDELAGVYPVCSVGTSGEPYLSQEFFDKVKLRPTSQTLVCDGLTFWKPEAHFTRIDAKNMIAATVSPSDYLSPAAVSSVETNGSGDEAKTPSQEVNATTLHHELGLWRDQVGTNSATLSLNGRQYSPYGLFAVEGYSSTYAGSTRGYVSDASWKRDFPTLGVSGKVGVNTVATTGMSSTLYGLVVGSDEEVVQANTAQSLEGFADVPGKLVISSQGTVVKEIPVSAGYFNIPASSLPSVSGAGGYYTLSLIDQSGRVVRTWNAFIPVGTQLVREGHSTWKVFAGQIEGNTARNSLIQGSRNLGGGLQYQYGITSNLTGEISGLMAEHSRGVGVAANFVPTPWLSMNGGWSHYSGDLIASNQYVNVDLHPGDLNLSAGYSSQLCNQSYLTANSVGRCRNVNLRASEGFPYIGRVTLLGTSTIGTSPRATSYGFSWSPSSLGRVNLSLYGTWQRYANTPSYSIGATATFSLGSGQILASTNYSGSDSSTYSTAYSTANSGPTQYSLGSNINRAASGTSGDLNGTVRYNPWYGNYQANAQLNSHGQVGVGVNESGTLLMTQGEFMATQAPDDGGYAIVHLPEMKHVSLEDGSGRRLGVTNGDGYAAFAATVYGAPDVRVPADELPENVVVSDRLTGKISRPWSAQLWQPTIRHVNHGWIRLVTSKGEPVQLGSMLTLDGIHPNYVLANGEVFIDDLPLQAINVDVHLPQSVGRCHVKFPGDVKLNENFSSDHPQFVCELS